MKILTVFLVLIVLAAGGWYGWRKFRAQAKETPVDYKTATVGRGDVVQTVTANGQISPTKSVTVGSQVSGIIVDIQADFNSKVTNGQVIAQIDPSTYQRVVTQAEAELANARAALELAQLDERRASALHANALISKAELDKAVVGLHQAEAVVQLREAVLDKARVDLQRTTILSPIDGVVISRAVDVGQTVAASFNTPTLFSIANDLRKMRIEAMVSEADVGGVQEGQTVNFTVDAYPTRQFQGQIIQVRFAPITNQNVVNYISVVEVDNSDLKLRPGMTANASIVVAERQGVLRVPNAALRFRPPESATDKGKTNAMASAGGIGRTNGAPDAATPPGGPQVASGGGEEGGRRGNPEWRKRMESMSPEEREQFRARMRERGADGGGGWGGGMGRRGGGSEGMTSRTVYLGDKTTVPGKETVQLKPMTVKLGITDGTQTEVLEGLNDGDVVVTGVNMPTNSAAGARPGSSPFGSPFGGFRPPR